MLGLIRGEPCPSCGRPALLRRKHAIDDALSEAWALDDAWRERIEKREGTHCTLCGASWRARHLARALVQYLQKTCGTTATSLAHACVDPRCAALRVAEINGAGRLHRYLTRLPHLAYSEFGSTNPRIRSEDLLNLSYPDNSFDLVITSETLEHVPNVDRALSEIQRILRPGGAHIFTVPIIYDRTTRQRAHLVGDSLTHNLPPSYHNGLNGPQADMLVFYEFGADFEEQLRAAGFKVATIQDPNNLAVVTFITTLDDFKRRSRC
ncbi:MAG: methyltransferase domain-containing protein [Myxococcales bacterium]|nr:methyltransferase domain-containing protein [Myxococcales bacterium]